MKKEKKGILEIISVVVPTLVGVVVFFAMNPKKSPDASEVGIPNTESSASAELETDGSEMADMREKTGMERVLEEKRPALVTLRASNDGVNFTVGSGFILDIQDDNIYICTSRHVIQDCENWEVGFYDGTSIVGTKAGVSQTYDVGIVELSREQLSAELLDNLFALEIDLEYWRRLEGKQVEVGFVSMYQEDTDKCVSGRLLKTLENYQWDDNQLRHSTFQLTFTDGDSGSAIFDDTGHFIAMVHGTSYSNDTDGPQRWGIPLSALAISYLEIINS